MKQIKTTDSIRVEIFFKGDEANRFRNYQEKEKLTSRAQAAYKLVLEALDREIPNKESALAK